MIEYINKDNFLAKREEFLKEIAQNQNRKTISLCLMVKNEQDWIADAIYSCYAIVDEIVVVDTGSTDNTLAILSDIPNINVIQAKWDNNFSTPRNIGIENCTKDWILRIDADERIPMNWLSKFWAMSQTTNNDIKAFVVPIKNYLENPNEKENPSFFVSETLRLFRRHPKIRYHKAIHEDIDESFKSMSDEKIKIVRTDSHIDHYGYLRDKDQLKTKHEKYAEILKSEIEKNPNNPSFYYSLAHHHKANKRYDLAEEYYIKTASICKEFWAAWNDLGTLYFWKGNFARCKECFEMAEKYITESASPTYKQRIAQNIKDVNEIERRMLAMFISDNVPLDLNNKL